MTPMEIVCGKMERGEMEIRPELEVIQQKLRELILKTILEDENASVVLCGYPGSGKTLVRSFALRSGKGMFSRWWRRC